MSNSRAWSWLLALLALVAGGCSTTLILQEDRPLNVTAAKPRQQTPMVANQLARVAVKKAEIEVNEKIHFEVDSDEIKPESFDLLEEIASVINEHDEIARIEVQGHTDNQGTKQYNKQLSQRRAEAVASHLIERGGVAADRLDAKGYGFDEPVASNDDDQGRAKNRRVEFHIIERK